MSCAVTVGESVLGRFGDARLARIGTELLQSIVDDTILADN